MTLHSRFRSHNIVSSLSFLPLFVESSGSLLQHTVCGLWNTLYAFPLPFMSYHHSDD
jgi:hypothetical protein